MNSRYFFMLLSLLFLTGCPATPTCVKTIDNRVTHLTLHLSEGCDSNRPATVNSVSFFSKRRSIFLWSVMVSEGVNSESPKLSEITYGIVPKGFSGKPAIQLQPGETIEVSVSGIGFAEPLMVTLTQ